MRNSLRKFFAPPIFPQDEDKTRSAYYLNVIVLVSIPVLILFYLARLAQGNQPFALSGLILLGLIGILILVLILLKNGFVRSAGYIHISTIWLASTLLALGGSGVRGSGFVSYFVVMLLAGLLLGARPAVAIGILSIISGFGLAYAETIGVVNPTTESAFSIAIEFTVLFIFITVFMFLTINSLQNALRNARSNASELGKSNRELSELRDILEVRVQERTAQLDRRASQLQTISDLARAIASVQDVDTLLPYITNLVSDRFSFYHAGIFLVDEINEFAVLRAANSEGGQRMLNRQHQLRLDNNSIVGYVTSHGEPRIALDVGTDAVYFNNPDLPNTRSEMALPLRIADRTIGALDVQSEQPNAFNEEDVATLSVLGDQVAIAIENARLFGEAHAALSESERTFEQYIKQQWSTFASQIKNTGYLFDGTRTLQFNPKGQREKAKTLAQTGRLSLEKESHEVTIPIRFRGQTVGFLEVKSKKGNRQWTRDEITLLESAAERAALALENARLVESARRRASRERAIGEISSKIGTVRDKDTIMRTTVEELARRLGGTMEVSLELDVETNPLPEENLE
jgi:GAF domain-containing protein